MNSILERVNSVCQCVRESNLKPLSFKKLVSITRTQFINHEFDVKIRTRKDRTLEECEFYVHAYYDAEDDCEQETSIEIVVNHNFQETDKFFGQQTTEFLIQIYDAMVHECKHQMQSRKRDYESYATYEPNDYHVYLQDPDELDAYGFSIAIEILRHMSRDRAERYMRRFTVMSKMKAGTQFMSPNLYAYVNHFGLNTLTKRLAKKVYKHLETLDTRYIFM